MIIPVWVQSCCVTTTVAVVIAGVLVAVLVCSGSWRTFAVFLMGRYIGLMPIDNQRMRETRMRMLNWKPEHLDVSIDALCQAADLWSMDGMRMVMAALDLFQETGIVPEGFEGFGVEAHAPLGYWGRCRNGTHVVMLRGTLTTADWVQNIRVRSANWRGFNVHTGFANLYERCLAPIAAKMVRTPRICIGAYSVGCALAQMLLVDTLPSEGTAYLFAPPRVGDSQFAKAVEAATQTMDARFVVNIDDPIHTVPNGTSAFKHAALPVHAFVSRANDASVSHSLDSYLHATRDNGSVHPKCESTDPNLPCPLRPTGGGGGGKTGSQRTW